MNTDTPTLLPTVWEGGQNAIGAIASVLLTRYHTIYDNDDYEE